MIPALRMKPVAVRVLLRVFHIFLLAVTVGLILHNSFKSSIGIYDEGFALTNALRILGYETPHLDYWSAYPPGSALVLALAFDLFEPSLLVARIVNAGWALVLVIGVYSIISKVQSESVAAIATFFVAWWFATAIYPSYSVTAALALCMTTGALLVLESKRKDKRIVVAAALVGGFTILFRHDFAFYTFCATATALIVDSYCLRLTQQNKPNHLKSYIPAVTFLAIFIFISLSLLLSLIYWSGFENVLDQMIIFPSTGMREHRLLPVPGFLQFFDEWKPHWLLAWSAPIALFAGGILSFRTGAWESSARRRVLLFSAVMSLLLILQSRNRFDLPHAAPSIMLVFVFISAVCVNPIISIKSRYVRFASIGLMIGFFAYSFLYLGYSARRVHNLNCFLPINADECMVSRAEQEDVVGYIKEHTNLNEYVFVGNSRHDEIFINDASLYFLLQRRIPVRWNEMHPGVITTREVQEAVVGALESKGVRYAVLVEIENPKESNMSANSSGVFILDEYIKNNFRQVFGSGKYSVHERIKHMNSK